MVIKSHPSIFLYPIVLLGSILFVTIFGVAVWIVIDDVSTLTNIGKLAGVLLLVWLSLFQLILFWTLIRNYVFHDDQLEVNYVFGMIRFYYPYKNLRISDYFFSTGGILIEAPNGDQMTIGEKQYKNFHAIKQSLETKIIKENIRIKFTTKFTRIMFVIGGVLLALTIFVEI